MVSQHVVLLTLKKWMQMFNWALLWECEASMMLLSQFQVQHALLFNTSLWTHSLAVLVPLNQIETNHAHSTRTKTCVTNATILHCKITSKRWSHWSCRMYLKTQEPYKEEHTCCDSLNDWSSYHWSLLDVPCSIHVAHLATLLNLSSTHRHAQLQSKGQVIISRYHAATQERKCSKCDIYKLALINIFDYVLVTQVADIDINTWTGLPKIC